MFASARLFKMPLRNRFGVLTDESETVWLLAMPSEIVYLIADHLDAGRGVLTPLASSCREMHALLRTHTSILRTIEQRAHASLANEIARTFCFLAGICVPSEIDRLDRKGELWELQLFRLGNMEDEMSPLDEFRSCGQHFLRRIAHYGVTVDIYNRTWDSKVSFKLPALAETEENTASKILLLGQQSTWTRLDPHILGLLQSGTDHTVEEFMLPECPYSGSVNYMRSRRFYYVVLQFGPYEFTHQRRIRWRKGHGDGSDSDDYSD